MIANATNSIMLAVSCKCNYHGDGDGSMGKQVKESRKSAWPVLITAYRRLVDGMEAELAAAGLPELTWYDVLWTLERAPDRRLRLHELARDVVLSRSNITRLVDRLEEAGLIRRERSEEDRRGYFAVITSEGLATRRRMWPVYARAIETRFDRHLSTREHATMRALLTRILEKQRSEEEGAG